MLTSCRNQKREVRQVLERVRQCAQRGPGEDYANREEIAKLLRFASTAGEGEAQTVSLEDYVGRMKEGQQKIYHHRRLLAAAKNSPHLEIFRKKGIEVLLMWERVDEWLMSHLTEFDGKQLVSVTRGELDLGDLEDDASKQAQEEAEKANAGLVERVKKSLGEAVKEVRVTHRLTDSPSCIVTDAHGMSTQMIKLMRAAGQPVPEQKYILELNPDHALVKKLAPSRMRACSASGSPSCTSRPSWRSRAAQ
jgi:molecular chaperone HtpG